MTGRARLALEVVGAALYVALHVVLGLTYVLGASLQNVLPGLYWSALGAGYLFAIGAALAPLRWVRAVSSRARLDWWLVTALPAAALTIALVALRWPVSGERWSGHGFGADGGEVNAAFFPWLHAVLLLATLRLRRPGAASG
jgi:membrane-bound metal-dependent hydrolase YbcI (DUF457 family)